MAEGKEKSLPGAAVVALILLAASAAGYAVLHKPLTAGMAVGLARSAWSIAAALLILAVAGAIGNRIAVEAHPDPLVRASIQTALGLGALAVFALGWGALGLLTSWWLALVTLGLGIALRSSLLVWVKELRRGLLGLWPTPRLEQVLLGLAAVWLAVELLEALAPPVQYDTLVYHLALPAQFLDRGRVVFTPDNPFWGMPLGASMLYAWAWAIGGRAAAPVLGWGIGFAALLGVLGLARTASGKSGAAAVAALLAGESIAASLGWAYADWLAALHGMALVGLLDSARQKSSHATVACAGLAAGFAFGAKLTAGAAIPIGAVALAAISRPQQRLRGLAIYFAGCLGAGIPWWVKNFLATGAPFYPFLGASPAIDPLRQALYRGAGDGLWERLAAPALATFFGVQGAPGLSASIGPLLLGLLPGVLLLRPSGRAGYRIPALLAAGGWLAWSLSGLSSPVASQTRLHMWMFPAWAVLADGGYVGLAGIRAGGVRFSVLAGTFLVLSLGLSLISGIQSALKANPAMTVLGLEETGAYQLRRLGAYAPAMEAVRGLDGEGQVLLLWEARSLDCLPICVPDPWLDRWIMDRAGGAAPEQIVARWQVEGFTHVLLHRAGMEFVRAEGRASYRASDWDALDATLALLTPEQTFGEGYALYRIQP